MNESLRDGGAASSITVEFVAATLSEEAGVQVQFKKAHIIN